MSKLQPILTQDTTLRTYTSRYTGGVLLACAKCQKKLKRDSHNPGTAKLAKSLKKLARQNGTEPVRVLSVSCLKLCPKGAVTVITPANLATTPPTLTLIRTAEDINALHGQLTLLPPQLAAL